MTESLVQKSDLEGKAKRKLIIGQVYIGVTILIIIISIAASFYIVKNKGENAIEIAEYVKDNRTYNQQIKDLEAKIEIAKNKPLRYELASFLPPEEQLTDLTRQFDNLFADWSSSGDFIENNNLSFGGARTDEENNISILPVTLNLTSSLDNFERFLHTIETSGLPGSELRLMDIQSISLSLASADTEEEETSSKRIRYSVSLNAYYQSS